MNKCRVGKIHKNSGSWAIALGLLEMAELCVSAAAQENTSYGWIDKGNDLAEQGSYDEAVKALDKATKLESSGQTYLDVQGPDPRSSHGQINKSIEAYERAIQIDPNDADAWFGKDAALNKATDLDPKLVAARKVKGDALRALGRNSGADAAFAKAEELRYKR